MIETGHRRQVASEEPGDLCGPRRSAVPDRSLQRAETLALLLAPSLWDHVRIPLPQDGIPQLTHTGRTIEVIGATERAGRPRTWTHIARNSA